MNERRALPLILALSISLATAALAEDGHDHHPKDATSQESHDEHGHEQSTPVRLSQAEIDEFAIEIGIAGPGVIETTVELAGEVRPNADRLAHIVPRYSGIVTAVHANTGDYVKRGQVLAVIESDVSLAPFEVKTLLSGTVIDKHIALGEAAARDRDAFVIADLSSVWIDLTLYQRDLDRIKVKQEAQVYVGHEPAQTGTITYITPIVDERTRTATARMVLANAEGRWRPGMFVSALVTIERNQVEVAVPRTALFTIAESPVVFVETEEGFAPQQVTLGRRGDTHIEVLEGLTVGARFVESGGFTLKAELGKDTFGDGHAH